MFGLLVVLTRATNKSFADLGWGRPTTRFALVAGIVVGLLYSVFTLSSPVFGSSATEVSLFKAWGAFVGVVGALVEEIAFRGFVMTELKEAGLPSLAQALVSALLFSLIHGGYGLLRGQFVLLPGLGLTFVLGLVLAGLYLAGRRSLTPPTVAHGLINLVIEPWLMLGFVTFLFPRSKGRLQLPVVQLGTVLICAARGPCGPLRRRACSGGGLQR